MGFISTLTKFMKGWYVCLHIADTSQQKLMSDTWGSLGVLGVKAKKNKTSLETWEAYDLGSTGSYCVVYYNTMLLFFKKFIWKCKQWL